MKVRSQGKVEDAQVIIAPSFGVREDKPGWSNVDIARNIKRFLGKRKIPVIAPKEVAEACESIVMDIGIIVAVIKEHRIEGRDLDTYEFLSQAQGIMEKKRWNKAILVAHPAHIPRAKRIFEKMRVEVIIPPGLESIPFDPRSIQWWTRNAFLWTVREIPARLISKIRGWI